MQGRPFSLRWEARTNIPESGAEMWWFFSFFDSFGEFFYTADNDNWNRCQGPPSMPFSFRSSKRDTVFNQRRQHGDSFSNLWDCNPFDTPLLFQSAWLRLWTDGVLTCWCSTGGEPDGDACPKRERINKAKYETYSNKFKFKMKNQTSFRSFSS